jgi:hypothetical protein
VNAKKALGLVPLGYIASMILEVAGIQRGGGDRELGQGRSECFRLPDLLVDLRFRQRRRRPVSLTLALNAGVAASVRAAINIDSILAFAGATVPSRVPILPFGSKQIGADVLKLVPALGRRELRCARGDHRDLISRVRE